ncbi:MAG: outer membrane protein assembly factor BamE [Burkholderiales bacterium]|nr:outer membrane protein assembly factor BamE [Burkholderiales bacterium]
MKGSRRRWAIAVTNAWTAWRVRSALAAATIGLIACSPYRIDIQQGNVVTQDMVSKLKTNMSRAQVKFVLGTPLVTDPFRPDRWDYFYEFFKAGTLKEKRRLTLVFENDQLKRIIGDVTPAPGGVPVEATEAPPKPRN